MVSQILVDSHFDLRYLLGVAKICITPSGFSENAIDVALLNPAGKVIACSCNSFERVMSGLVPDWIPSIPCATGGHDDSPTKPGIAFELYNRYDNGPLFLELVPLRETNEGHALLKGISELILETTTNQALEEYKVTMMKLKGLFGLIRGGHLLR